MGKFYLENKHKWFKHMSANDHQKMMESGGSLAVAGEAVSELRFYHNDDSEPSTALRLTDHDQAQIAVISGNGFVGFLDDESSAVVRSWLKDHPDFDNEVPATLIRQEEISGAYIVKIGVR